MAAEFVGPVALIIGLWPRATAMALVIFTATGIWLAYGSSVLGLMLQPTKNGELFERLAIVGGLLFYFASGPGAWSRTSLR
jgi:putative oxidoreductase